MLDLEWKFIDLRLVQQVQMHARAYPCFHSMKKPWLLPLPQDCMVVHSRYLPPVIFKITLFTYQWPSQEGWPWGTPSHLHNDIYKSPPIQKQDFLTKSYKSPSTRDKEEGALPSQKVHYLRTFLFAVIISIAIIMRVNKI